MMTAEIRDLYAHSLLLRAAIDSNSLVILAATLANVSGSDYATIKAELELERSQKLTAVADELAAAKKELELVKGRVWKTKNIAQRRLLSAEQAVNEVLRNVQWGKTALSVQSTLKEALVKQFTKTFRDAEEELGRMLDAVEHTS